MTRVPGVPRKPGGGFKKKIAKLEAENGELKQALAESEKRCAILEYRLSRSKNTFSLSNAEE